jgi:hypothetical protein
VPSHILVNNLGLTYKGTIGISTATVPDVCKTPSPGGPIPIPYPNTANQGSLNKGTKSVKAKNKMIAVKGSEYSMSFGDEPGTAGGVKSGTFKKETAWITYSFDVKMDGRNACRHTDKKFHNHKNTVCLSGQKDPVKALTLAAPDCNERVGNQPRWDDCQKEEFCRMVEEFNKVPEDDITVVRPSPGRPVSPLHGPATKSGTYLGSLKRFEDNFAAKVTASPADEDWIRSQFYTECRYNQWKNGNPYGDPAVAARAPNPPRSSKKGGALSMNPDHVHDAGLGGSLSDLDNIKWVNSKVNKSLGKAIGDAATKGRYQPGMKISLENCDCPNS